MFIDRITTNKTKINQLKQIHGYYPIEICQNVPSVIRSREEARNVNSRIIRYCIASRSIVVSQIIHHAVTTSELSLKIVYARYGSFQA